MQNLIARDPAAHAAIDNPLAVAMLLEELREAQAHDQVQRLLTRFPLDAPDAVANLLMRLRKIRAYDQAQILLARDPAAHATLANLDAVVKLLRALREAEVHDQAEILAARAAAHAPLDDPDAVAGLLYPLSAASNSGPASRSTASSTPQLMARLCSRSTAVRAASPRRGRGPLSPRAARFQMASARSTSPIMSPRAHIGAPAVADRQTVRSVLANIHRLPRNVGAVRMSCDSYVLSLSIKTARSWFCQYGWPVPGFLVREGRAGGGDGCRGGCCW